jgi:hypothetical protein
MGIPENGIKISLESFVIIPFLIKFVTTFKMV